MSQMPVKSVSCAEQHNAECGGEVQFPCYGQARSFVLSERIDAENGFTTHPRPHCPQKSSLFYNQVSTNGIQMSMD